MCSQMFPQSVAARPKCFSLITVFYLRRTHTNVRNGTNVKYWHSFGLHGAKMNTQNKWKAPTILIFITSINITFPFDNMSLRLASKKDVMSHFTTHCFSLLNSMLVWNLGRSHSVLYLWLSRRRQDLKTGLKTKTFWRCGIKKKPSHLLQATVWLLVGP